MFETVKRWNRKWSDIGKRSAERDFETTKTLINAEKGRAFFEGYLLQGALAMLLIGAGLGYVFGLNDYPNANVIANLAHHWGVILALAIIGVILGFAIEHYSHPTRDFYRKRKELFGRRFA